MGPSRRACWCPQVRRPHGPGRSAGHSGDRSPESAATRRTPLGNECAIAKLGQRLRRKKQLIARPCHSATEARIRRVVHG